MHEWCNIRLVAGLAAALLLESAGFAAPNPPKAEAAGAVVVEPALAPVLPKRPPPPPKRPPPVPVAVVEGAAVVPPPPKRPPVVPVAAGVDVDVAPPPNSPPPPVLVLVVPVFPKSPPPAGLAPESRQVKFLIYETINPPPKRPPPVAPVEVVEDALLFPNKPPEGVLLPVPAGGVAKKLLILPQCRMSSRRRWWLRAGTVKAR